MKVNTKKAGNSKGKGLVKDVKLSPGTQTITSMFKKQTASLKTQAPVHCSPSKSTSSDDDVKIIKVESHYFGQSSAAKCDEMRPHTRRKLSLRRSISSKSGKDSKSELNVSTKTESNIEDEMKVTDAENYNASSQKENSLDTDRPKKQKLDTDRPKKQKLDTDRPKKQKLDTDRPKKQKLSIRKRKSDTQPENSCKKNKLTGESQQNLSSQIISSEGSEGDGIMSENKVMIIDDEDSKTQTNETACSFNKIQNDDVNTSKIKSLRDNDGESVKQVPSTSQLTVNSTQTDKLNDDDDANSQLNGDGEIEEDKVVEFRTPYYLENFRTVLNTIFADENNVKLYNSDDMEVITTFNDLSESAQKLYLRLFCRKWTWLPLNKIKYPEIAENLTSVVDELVEKNLFITDKELLDLKTVLKMLSGGDVKSLGKTYHINTSSQNKSDILELLIKKTKQNTIGSMFKIAGNSPETVMLNRAKKLLGTCVSVAEGPRDVFARTMMLFSLTDTVLDEDSSGQTLQLFQMLRVNIGQVTYPEFTVNKQTQIFHDREALLRFCKASLLEFDILTKLEKNRYDEAFSIYEEAVKQYDSLTKETAITGFDNKLPVFLRPYTACGVYTRALNQGVEILQRRKDYQSAVDLLKKLLSQDCYCQHYRGHWWERLALNYDTHLKKQDLALEAAEKGLTDKLVKTGRRLALYQRAEKICTGPKSKYKGRMKDFKHDKLLELPVATIDGQTLSDCIQGQKYKFMIQYSQGEGQSDPDDIAFCGVEEVVLDHYKHNGFTDGIHAEGSVVSCLFGLFFWDIMFMDVPDVFHSPYQSTPLDLHTEEFYFNRQTAIDERLEMILNSSIEDLNNIVSKTWEEHEGTICAGLNWERFNNLQHVQGLVECIGGKTLSGILGRYAKDPRHTRSGFPDLTLWNTETKHFKISEVKGPGDRLSHKQILWLDFLLKLGVDAEVCHVKAVGSKRLKKIPSCV